MQISRAPLWAPAKLMKCQFLRLQLGSSVSRMQNQHCISFNLLNCKVLERFTLSKRFLTFNKSSPKRRPIHFFQPTTLLGHGLLLQNIVSASSQTSKLQLLKMEGNHFPNFGLKTVDAFIVYSRWWDAKLDYTPIIKSKYQKCQKGTFSHLTINVLMIFGTSILRILVHFLIRD